jgi:hypothetical protein
LNESSFAFAPDVFASGLAVFFWAAVQRRMLRQRRA